MQLTLKQTEVLSNDARWKVLNFGRRSGKTTELAWEAFVVAMKGNAKITYYAQTFDDARNIAWDIFLSVFGEAVINKNETRLEIKVQNLKKGISTISLKGWESVVTSEKGRGTENNLLLLDEVAFCRGFKHYWDLVLEPTLLTTKGRAVFSSTPNGFNDFYQLANKAQKEEDWLYVHATSYDNPYNDSKELDRLKAEKTDDAFAQEYMADFRKQEGLVFKEFNRQLHTYDEMPTEELMHLGGADPGFVNPAGIISVRKDKRGTYWVKEEFYGTGKTDAQLAELVASMEFQKLYPDPENAGFIQELNNRNVNVHEVLKGKESITKGIGKMREMFKQRRMRIHKDSINLLWEIETYHYPKKTGALEKDEDELPVHKDCHLIDALRYIVLMDTDVTEIKTYESWLGRRVSISPKNRLNPAR